MNNHERWSKDERIEMICNDNAHEKFKIVI